MRRLEPATPTETAKQDRRRLFHLAKKDHNNAKAKEWRAAHASAQKAYFKKYNSENTEKIAARAKEWRKKNPQPPRDRSAYNAEYAKKNAAVLRQKRILKYQNNRDAMLLRSRAFREKNPSYWIDRYEKFKERVAEANRAWRAANPEKVIAARHRRRSRIRNGGGSGVTPAEWNLILEQYGNLCAYCRKTNGTKRLERDHVIPISKGGLDEPENVVPACRRCNARKAARLGWKP